MSKPAKTIKAPNGTVSFIKPNFDVVLYEETPISTILGRVDFRLVEWTKDGKCSDRGCKLPRYDLTPALQPWYENLDDGILCRVKNLTKPILVTHYQSTNTKWPIKGIGYSRHFTISEVTPLTQEEVMKYVAKQ